MSDPRYVLTAEDVGKRFGRTQVLKAASIWAESGKVTTLMGRNGSGKTTLIRIAAGVLRADHGSVSFNHVVVKRPSLARLARLGLMYVPQEQLLIGNMRVRDHLSAVAATYGGVGVDEAIDKTRIEATLDQRAHELSGGERMRVSLALAFARRPTVLLVDEPLTGLAPKDQEDLGNALRALAREGTAVVTSGHDTRVLLDVSDVIVWSVAGTTHHIGSPREARTNEQFCREYLGIQVSEE